jgi:uncharacterized damage-inducible protein DinB
MTPQEAKSIAEFLMSNLESEIPLTMGVFAAVPDERLDYTPDPRSKTALGLLRHITLEDEWFLKSVCDGKFEPPPDDSDTCGIMTPADAVEQYKAHIFKAVERVRGLSGEDLTRTVDLLGMIQAPAVTFLSMALRHSAHHRGQLSTYLRVPPIYGPTADTPPPSP